MAIEIEKMNVLRDKIMENEGKQVDQIIDVLDKAFNKMIDNTRIFLTTGEKVEMDYSHSIEALQKLKALGDQNGVEFPEITTNEEAAIYILQFGRQIIKGREE